MANSGLGGNAFVGCANKAVTAGGASQPCRSWEDGRVRLPMTTAFCLFQKFPTCLILCPLTDINWHKRLQMVMLHQTCVHSALCATRCLTLPFLLLGT